jgi:hypothetical protein
MTVLAKDMDTWRVNFQDMAKATSSGILQYLTFGRSWFWESECRAIETQMRTLEKQMVAMNKQYSTISGKAGVPGADKPASSVKKTGPRSWATDLAWDLLKIGTVGLGVWYGGKLLYSYLDEKTRIPPKRLPRYAGGRRRSR